MFPPGQARQKALGRFEARAEAKAAKLRARVGFEVLELRSDKRLRLEQFHKNLSISTSKPDKNST